MIEKNTSAASLRRKTKLPFNQPLESCKYLAILLIVCLHTGFPRGYQAVEFFFIVSGFFLVNSVFTTEENVFSWLIHKIKKIYPLYIGSLFLSLSLRFISTVIIHKLSVFDFIQQNSDVFYEMFFLQRVGFTTYSINTPDWYISAMLFAGFILYFLLSKYHESIFPVLCIAIIIIVAFLINRAGHLDQHSTILFGAFDISGFRAFAGMSIGVLLYESIKNKQLLKNRLLANSIEIITLICIIIGIFAIKGRHHKGDILFYPLFCLVVYSCFNCKGIISKLLENKILVYLSKYELSLYLTHIFTIRCCNKLFQYLNFGVYVNYIIRIIVCIIFSIIFHHIIYGGIKIIKRIYIENVDRKKPERYVKC
jgi:peptidoglycan/LPS O-acetylase OafA/YrhL